VQARIPGDGLLSVVGGGQQISDPRSVRNLLQRSKFAAFIWEPKDADPRGTSILRPCYINWWQKLQVLGSWLQWLALCATPMLVGVLSDNADAFLTTDAAGNVTNTPSNALQQLLNILIQARSGNAMALPPGTQIHWLTPPGEGEQFVKAVTYHDQCMTRAITLQTLATQDSEHNTRAASQVHQDTLGVGVRKARGVLGRVWTWDVWYWLCYWNFGKAKADALCPRAVLTPVEQHDRQSQLPAYASVGYQLAPSQLQAVDEELGFPQRTPEEARPPEPPQAPPSGQNGTGNGGPKPPPGGGKGGKPSGQEAGFAGEGDGHWVTIEGEHVFIKGGVITKGPAALVGKDPSRLPPRSETQPSHASPRKVKDSLHGFVSHVNTLGTDVHNLWPNQQKAEAALEGLSHAELRELARALGHDDPGPSRDDALRAARMAVGSAFAEASGHETPRPASLRADLSKVDDALHHGTPAAAVAPEEGARALAAVKSRAEAGLSASPAGFLAKRTYRKATAEALARMPPAAHARLERGLRAVHYGADRQSTGLAAFEAGMREEARVAESEGRHADAAASRSALEAVRKDPASLGSVGGCYVRGEVKAAFVDGLESNPTGGTSRGGADYVVRGKDHAGVYAHEFTHAVDHADAHSLSDAVAWRDAFHGELAGGRLTEYAGTSPSEAFAEFGRVLYTGGRDPAKVERDFPQASAYFKGQGLWPAK
jgi:hypothetical protein